MLWADLDTTIRAMLSPEQLARRRGERARIYRQRRLAAVAGLIAVLVAGAVVAISDSGGSATRRRHSARLAVQRAARAQRPVTITVEASGDLLIHSPVWERA